MLYEIKEAPKTMLDNTRGTPRKHYPFDKLEIGQMFEINVNQKASIYNAIKHRTLYTKELEGRKFSIRTIDKLAGTMAVIRIA